MANKEQPVHLKEFSKHTTQLREKAAVLGHDVQELGKITKDLAQDTMGLLSENATGYYQQGMQQARKWEEGLEGRIRKNPIQSLLIAAGVGVILGAIWKSR